MKSELEVLPILILDFQATGPRPPRGQLLEFGWATLRTSQKRPVRPHSSFLLPPRGFEMPGRIRKITGVSLEQLKGGVSPERATRILRNAARGVAGLAEKSRCPTVIHFSRYEQAFLEDLFGPPANEDFPFDVVCTHEIAKRLLPGLPRRGLRAVAGYLGHSVPEYRRSADHVEATAAIWKSFVPQLGETLGITTWNELKTWLLESRASNSCGREYALAADIRQGLPKSPGVYRMCRADGEVVYVGKASSLRSRVNSYFQKRKGHPDHILEMLAQAHRIDCTVTSSALEAALLESDQIKMLSPQYNKALRSGQRGLVFCSRDLKSLTRLPDRSHPLGPLMEVVVLDLFRCLVEIGQLGWDSRGQGALENSLALRGIGSAIVALPDGWREFVSRNSLEECSWSRPEVMALGSRLWKEQKAAEAIEEERTDRGIDDNSSGEAWSSEHVARFLEEIVRTVTHGLRRARWLCWLTESVISWSPRGFPDTWKHVLTVESGRTVEFSRAELHVELPVPPGCRKTMDSRKTHLDLITYDRMVVLTRELRRLLQEDRFSEIRLGRMCRLRAGELRMILQWI